MVTSLETQMQQVELERVQAELDHFKKQAKQDLKMQKQEVVRRGIETLVSIMKINSTSFDTRNSLDASNVKLANEKLKTFEALEVGITEGITESCGCVGCDLELPIEKDFHGYGTAKQFPCSLSQRENES